MTIKKLRKIDIIIIAATVIVFVIIIAANASLVIRSMRNQTEQIGQTQISNIKTDFENYIANAENSLIRVASGAEQLMKESSRKALEYYIIEQKKIQYNSSNGVNFNVYIAGQGWEIIPDFDAPEDYHATERTWYIGAVENEGEIFISNPYIDSMTGDMCYTMSVMLSDRQTVVAMDFTLSEIQQSIEKMSLSKGSSAMITTADGLIVGYTDMSYVGKNMDKVLPEYTPILEDILDNLGEESFKANINNERTTIFYSVTQNNWYMIISVNDNDLYWSTTRQIVINVVINLLMLILIVVLYFLSIRNRIKTEIVQESREKFVNKLIDKLRDPLDNIIRTSNETGTESGVLSNEFEEVKASGLRINEILNDLSSYSSIVSGRKEKSKEKSKSNDLFKSIRSLRNVIVVLLILVLFLSSFFFYSAVEEITDNALIISRNYYKYELNQWELEQKTILKMFADMVSADPEILDDYNETVKWLDSIAKKYPNISACYLANPYSEHTVIMNTGWQPDKDWKVEEREWYRTTEKSEEGYSISSPYIDEQTGNYCITMSQMVYGKNGEFVGIFGIDFYMDKVIEIFGQSYTDEEYVILVDSNGDIINHPDKKYQMSENSKKNIVDTPYLETYNDSSEEKHIITDVDGVRRISQCTKDSSTNFTIILLWEYWSLSLYKILYTCICTVIIFTLILAIIIILNKAIRSQTNLNQKLSDAVHDAEVAGNAKTEFLAQMSHEIRTPINAVIGMDEMILRETDDPGIREYATDIMSAGNTLLTLINGVLDFSKLENGKMDIIPVKYNTAELIDSLVNMISDRADKKKLELKMEIDPNIPKVLYGDDVRIRQAITNLLTNAVKYTEKGTVSLIMRGENISQNDCTLYVEVKDTGIGIKEEDMEKMFKSFQRLDEKKNRTIEGTGLGMSIVDGILKLMNSELKVESEYGVGSSFSFRLKQSVINPEPLGEYHRHMVSEVKKKDCRGLIVLDANILVVDDNEMNLKVAKGLMKKMKVIPDLAGSGQEAIEKIKKKHYNIIFLDHMMPGMDGLETLKQIKKGSLIEEDTAVIALTANAISGAREMYISEGFSDYLSKPINPVELEDILEEYLPEGRYTFSSNIQKAVGNTFTDKLSEMGFNVKKALAFCMNDTDFYREMLETFVLSEGEKKRDIESSFNAKNWNDYRIQVHALKSSAKTIGADNLSGMALKQENAAKESDEAVIVDGIAPLMEEYSSVVRQIKSVIDINTESIKDGGAASDEDDMEIMEFLPE